ncbi:hypothetical protein COS83_02605 [archaeon CG07_land_8_20_14_0_80_38_8]|nr:MAG: hypothetical protein COS83_02605 [archaeon CG07_land_8_20_14_0_80_38_8]
MKIIYEPVSFELKNEKAIIELLKNDFRNSFIAATAQYKSLLADLPHKNKGVILGCRVSAVKKFKGDSIVFVGDGVFHALMLKKEFRDRKVFILNPFNLNVKEVFEEDVRKFDFREAVSLDYLKRAVKVGIILSSKSGQFSLDNALRIKEKLENDGKKVYLFLFDNVNPDEFMNFKGIDCLVNTACPRIGMDDYKKFPVPVVNANIIL